jgi:hypothetical protein
MNNERGGTSKGRCVKVERNDRSELPKAEDHIQKGVGVRCVSAFVSRGDKSDLLEPGHIAAGLTVFSLNRAGMLVLRNAVQYSHDFVVVEVGRANDLKLLESPGPTDLVVEGLQEKPSIVRCQIIRISCGIVRRKQFGLPVVNFAVDLSDIVEARGISVKEHWWGPQLLSNHSIQLCATGSPGALVFGGSLSNVTVTTRPSSAGGPTVMSPHLPPPPATVPPRATLVRLISSTAAVASPAENDV